MADHPAGCGCLECPDPHEDWYFALLPPDWKAMSQSDRLAEIRRLDPVTRAECRRRMRHRRIVAQGRFLAQQDRERDEEMKRRLYHGFALDAALYRIALRSVSTQPVTVTGSTPRDGR